VLFKTIRALYAQVNYTRLDDGRWRADFRGFCEASATDASLERCRSLIIDMLDDRLARFLGAPPDAESDAPPAPGPTLRN
jgi:hypothetical protein